MIEPLEPSLVEPTPEGPLDIAQILAAAFYHLNSRGQRKKRVRCFSLTIAVITHELVRRVESTDDCLELKALSEMTMDEVLAQLPSEFHDLKEACGRRLGTSSTAGLKQTQNMWKCEACRGTHGAFDMTKKSSTR